jgi:hypothetical protein
VPNEWGLFAARPLSGGELISAMQDGKPLGKYRSGSRAAREAVARAGGADAHYLYEHAGGLYDGRACRPGGACRANDPRGTTQVANAVLMSTGCLNVLSWREIPALRPGQSAKARARCEVLYAYGEAFWA